MKRIVTTLCALAVIMVGSIPAMAAEEPPRQDASYYPISVDEYTYGELEEPRINKVYQLSLSDDPSLIPTEDFERDGLWFTLLDMTRKNEVGVDTQPYTETVTRPSKTNDMAQVLQALEAEMEVTTAEGYAGTLHLDHTSVQVKTDGYQAMWDEMMTKGTRGNNDYTHWISRICRIGADLHEFRRNTNWMLSTYFDKLTSHRREDYIDAFARFKEDIRDAKLVDLDDDDQRYLSGDPSPYSFRFDFPAHISFIPYLCMPRSAHPPAVSHRSYRWYSCRPRRGLS